MRSEREIGEALNEVLEQMDQGGSKFPGLSYEEGAQAALDYVLGTTDAKPMDE